MFRPHMLSVGTQTTQKTKKTLWLYLSGSEAVYIVRLCLKKSAMCSIVNLYTTFTFLCMFVVYVYDTKHILYIL